MKRCISFVSIHFATLMLRMLSHTLMHRFDRSFRSTTFAALGDLLSSDPYDFRQFWSWRPKGIVQVLLFCFRISIFCHVLFVLFCVLLYCLMYASVCISSSEALTSLTSSLQTLIEINSFDQLVTKTYPRLCRFNRWLLYFNEWSGTVLNKEKKEDC